MAAFNYAGDSGIYLDRCEDCDGLWLDAGELRSVAIFLKGTRKLNRMGESLSDDLRRVQDFEEQMKWWRFDLIGQIPVYRSRTLR